MAKATMQKWQRDHFVSELNRNYDPLINAAELKLKSIEAEAIEIAEKIWQMILEQHQLLKKCKKLSIMLKLK